MWLKVGHDRDTLKKMDFIRLCQNTPTCTPFIKFYQRLKNILIQRIIQIICNKSHTSWLKVVKVWMCPQLSHHQPVSRLCLPVWNSKVPKNHIQDYLMYQVPKYLIQDCQIYQVPKNHTLGTDCLIYGHLCSFWL